MPAAPARTTSPTPTQAPRAPQAPGAPGSDPQALLAIRERVERFRRLSDGVLFGYVGLDALTGLVPGVGALYSAGGGLWLLRQAARAGCSRGTLGYGAWLVAADVLVGALPVLGDVADIFLRSHAWFAGRIVDDIDARLAAGAAPPNPAAARHLTGRDRRRTAAAAALVALVLAAVWLVA